MGLEVKNLQTGESYDVGAGGAVIGRTGGGATIEVEDRAVSKKHARIFVEAGQWFIEDMGSVNGTVVDGNKIGEAVALSSGLIFSLSKHKFEVVRVAGRAAKAPAPAPAPELETQTSQRGNNAANLPSALRKDPVPRRRGAPPPRFVDDDLVPPEPTRGELPPASDQDVPPPAPFVPPESPSIEPEPPRLGIDSYQALPFIDALMLGLEVSAKTAPSLVLRPFLTVQRQVAEAPWPGVQHLALGAMVLPSTVLAIVLTSAAATVVAGVVGQLSAVDVLLIPVQALVGGAIGAAVTGFVWHPVLAFLVARCGGRSDARARTAQAAATVASVLVLAIPLALATAVTGVVGKLVAVSSLLAFVQVIPALLCAVALPLPVFAQWSWWKSYGVAKWVTTIWLVLTLVAALLGVVNVIQSVSAAMSHQGMSSNGPTPDGLTKTGSDEPSATAPTPPMMNSTLTTPKSMGITTKTPPPPMTTTEPTNLASPPPQGTVATRPTSGTDGTAPMPTPILKVDPIAATTARKRADIESVLEQDPTLILRSERVRRLYQTLLEQTARAETTVNDEVDTARPELSLLIEKLRRARVLEASRETVDDLHRELFGTAARER